MASIRMRLISGTATAMTLILAGCGIVVYISVRAALNKEFDMALAAKAKALASMVEFKHDGSMKLEFDPAQMPEFVHSEHPEYFQCWTSDGSIIFRSDSLGQHNLELVRSPFPGNFSRKSLL